MILSIKCRTDERQKIMVFRAFSIFIKNLAKVNISGKIKHCRLLLIRFCIFQHPFLGGHRCCIERSANLILRRYLMRKDTISTIIIFFSDFTTEFILSHIKLGVSIVEIQILFRGNTLSPNGHRED